MEKSGFYFLWFKRLLLLFSFSVIIISCNKKDVLPFTPAIPTDTTTHGATDTTTVPADTAASQPADTIPLGKRFTYLALGDSYTIGQNVDSSLRFPAQTAALLKQKNLPFSAIQYIATTGWTTINLMDAIQQQQPQGPYDIVSLLIGVNDQYQTGDTTNYRSHFTDLLNTAISLAGNKRDHVFVLSIPDYGVTPFGSGKPDVAKEVDQFNTINKDVTINNSISYTDVTTISRNDAGDATMITTDGLHPSGKQYAQWAQALEPSIYAVLK